MLVNYDMMVFYSVIVKIIAANFFFLAAVPPPSLAALDADTTDATVEVLQDRDALADNTYRISNAPVLPLSALPAMSDEAIASTIDINRACVPVDLFTEGAVAALVSAIGATARTCAEHDLSITHNSPSDILYGTWQLTTTSGSGTLFVRAPLYIRHTIAHLLQEHVLAVKLIQLARLAPEKAQTVWKHFKTRAAECKRLVVWYKSQQAHQHQQQQQQQQQQEQQQQRHQDEQPPVDANDLYGLAVLFEPDADTATGAPEQQLHSLPMPPLPEEGVFYFPLIMSASVHKDNGYFFFFNFFLLI